jgi:Uma2 family endonuclease
MVSPAPTSFTEAEYLALEGASDRRHEFVDGVIVAMAGARPPHNVIAANVTAALVALGRPRGCVAMTSDQRVHVPATRLYAYPDVIVACGERRYDDGDPPSLLNPAVIVEVTSDSTEDYDRGTKFLHYQAIDALCEYVLVSHRERRIDRYRRLDEGGWLLSTATGEDASIDLGAVGGSLSLADVYAGVDLDEGRRAG